MSNTTKSITVGTRVRALDIEEVGSEYRGKVGTVKATSNSDAFEIAFDDEATLPLGDGGLWSPDSVEILGAESRIVDGARVRVVNGPTRRPAPEFLGKVGTVVNARTNLNRVVFDDGAEPHGGSWSDECLEVIEDATPARPTILLEHETSRDYARAADSRVLDAHHRAILTKAADGHPVDAYAFNAALTAAMSSAATRLGQSMARRALTSKIRHLAYKTQAVLENHADSLPAYETGERSRLVISLREEIAQIKDAASAERRRLCAEIDDNHRQAVEEGAKLQEEIDSLNQRVDALRSTANRSLSVLQYAMSFLDETHVARVHGYADRVNEGE